MRPRPCIAILNSSIHSANEKIFLDLHVQTLSVLCSELFVLTGNYPVRLGKNIHIIEIEKGEYLRKPSLLSRVAGQLVNQVKLTYHLVKLSKVLDVVFFDIGEYRNVLPVIVSRLLKKKTVVFHHGGNKSLESRLENSSGFRTFIPPVQDVLLRICYLLVDHILCISPSIIAFGRLEKYAHKIMFWGGDYVDLETFRIKVPPNRRGMIVGYAGRFSPKKGMTNLVKAVPLVSKKYPELEFLIAGSGQETDMIVKKMKEIGSNKVRLLSWIPDEELPDFLNQLKLFVLPSIEEGTPGILRNAMACGVTVLATPVGGIPDLVSDGKTGFILGGITPCHIAEGILRALNNPCLDEIALAGRKLVETESSFEVTVKKWRAILAELLGENRT